METSMITQKNLSRTLAIALVGGLALLGASHAVWAGDLSAQQILDGLKVSKTRSLSAPERPALTTQDLALIKRVRGKTRSLSLDEREQIATITPKRPTIDLDINFDYNSASLTPQVEPQLNNLGQALTSNELAGSVIMLGGHTDAKGTDDYNQSLSERRAETVKRYLIAKYRIPAKNLISAGYGKKGPKNPNDLFAAENRRVEIVNMAERDEAAR
jgi:outer membrane protein OmpA-like peptidoglycan-associated protein